MIPYLFLSCVFLSPVRENRQNFSDQDDLEIHFSERACFLFSSSHSFKLFKILP